VSSTLSTWYGSRNRLPAAISQQIKTANTKVQGSSSTTIPAGAGSSGVTVETFRHGRITFHLWVRRTLSPPGSARLGLPRRRLNGALPISLCWGPLRMHLQDVGGEEKLRPYWRHYYTGTQGVVFVVDASDRERLSLAALELRSLANDEQLAVRDADACWQPGCGVNMLPRHGSTPATNLATGTGSSVQHSTMQTLPRTGYCTAILVPLPCLMQDAAIAVAVNKTDAPGALSVTEVQEAMGLSTYVRCLTVRLHANTIASPLFMHTVLRPPPACRSLCLTTECSKTTPGRHCQRQRSPVLGSKMFGAFLLSERGRSDVRVLVPGDFLGRYTRTPLLDARRPLGAPLETSLRSVSSDSLLEQIADAVGRKVGKGARWSSC
jgi:hypothetical protein